MSLSKSENHTFFSCRKVDADEILPLRAKELRIGQPVDSARFPEDHLPDTLHFGAYSDTELVGCVTLILSTSAPLRKWQLRGMATRSGQRLQGVGRTLLQFAESHLQQHYPGSQIWCNARIGAIPFYRKMGFTVCSDPFEIEGIGVHHKMEKTLL